MHIDLRAITKRYGSARALDGVSLQLAPGRIVAILGANGSGKTTLLRCLAGLLSPNKGEILYDDKEFSRDDIELRRKIFFLADFPNVFQEMTPLQHIGMCLKLYEARREGVEQLTLELFRDLNLLPLADVPIGTLSRGQTYKAALAALTAVDPELWLLDEPFASGMDPQGINVFKQRAREAAQRGRTILYTTQIIEVVEKFSDQICVLDAAELKAVGTFSELRLQSNANPALHKIFSSLSEEQ